MGRYGALLSLFIFFLIGCDSAEHIGGKQEPKRIQTVVSLSPSTTELMGLYGEGLALIGRTSSCNHPEYIKSTPIVGDVKPDYEKIAALHPDIILYDATLYNDADVQKIKELGIEAFPMEVHSVDDFIDYLHRSGSKLGKETRFSEYVDKIYAARNTAQAVTQNKDKRVAVLLGMGEGTESMIAGIESFQADLVRAAGATPVGPDGKKFVTTNAEALIALNPDVILSGGNAEEILKDTRLASINAVKKARVVNIDQDVLLRAGGRVNDFIKRTSEYLTGLK